MGRPFLLLAVSTLLLTAPAAAPASASAEDSYAMFGQGRPPNDSARSDVTVRGAPVHMERHGRSVRLSVPDTGEGFTSVEFELPKGKPLRKGVYAIGNDVGDNDRAGLTVDECGPIEGRYEIKDVATGPDGKPTRLWLLFEQRCRDGVLFYGEVRINQPATGVMPAYVRWAALDKGARGSAVPVTFAGTVASVRVSGPFRVVESGPSQVWVAPRPKGTGLQRGTLLATMADGSTRSIPLRVFVHGGRTGMTIGNERQRPPSSGFTVERQTDQIRFQATSSDKRWAIELEGRGLREGTTRTSGLEIVRNGLECQAASSRFTITRLRLKRGHIASFEVRFTQRCRSGPTLQGTASWRAR